MKKHLFGILVAASSVIIVLCFLFSASQPIAAVQPEEKAVTDWKKDPPCQMVFFAVIEGLYADGVPDDVVDSIVPRKKNGGDNPLKTSFVMQCPLSQSVYEAFSLYQQRSGFGGEEKMRNTFGKGLDADFAANLKSSDLRTRLLALRALVRLWVERRLTMMRLTKAEKYEWGGKLQVRGEQGRRILYKLRQTDPHYKNWNPYWACAACDGAAHAHLGLKIGGKKD